MSPELTDATNIACDHIDAAFKSLCAAHDVLIEANLSLTDTSSVWNEMHEVMDLYDKSIAESLAFSTIVKALLNATLPIPPSVTEAEQFNEMWLILEEIGIEYRAFYHNIPDVHSLLANDKVYARLSREDKAEYLLDMWNRSRS